MNIGGDSARVARPLYQAEYGGSIPTSPLQFTFYPIERETMETLNRLWHSRLPDFNTATPCSIYYGAEFDGIYYAVAAWSPPVARMLPVKWLELRRLAISEDAPKNTASRMIGWMTKDVIKRFPNVTRLISYQDTDFHTGTIYKASGWISTSYDRGGEWNRPSRFRKKVQSSAPKQRWDKIIRATEHNNRAITVAERYNHQTLPLDFGLGVAWDSAGVKVSDGGN